MCRAKGLEVNTYNEETNTQSRVISIQDKNIQAMLDSQFKVEATGYSTSLGSSLKHELLMEKYITDKLNVLTDIEHNNVKPEQVILKDEDRLYMVPDNIKAMGVSALPLKEDRNGAGIDGNVGIVEVLLHEGFKTKNIEDTEEARRLIELEKESRQLLRQINSRKDGHNNKPKSYFHLAKTSSQPYYPGHRKFKDGVELSTDDAAVDKFRKSQRNFRK